MIQIEKPCANTLIISNLRDFDLAQIFECGQAFRFSPALDGGYCGVARGVYVEFGYADGTLTINGNAPLDASLWTDYFDLSRDYGAVKERLLSQAPNDAFLREAIESGGGIRILRQDPWETICSFIISQNNNIPRIKKIIERLSFAFGEPIGGNKYAFPTAARLAASSEAAFTACGTGFRARYILDAAQKFSSGSLSEIFDSSYSTARVCDVLQGVRGIGPKVSACVALFGLGRLDAFPVDVWIKKVLSEHYPNGSPLFSGEYAGIAQQYLFYRAREGT